MTPINFPIGERVRSRFAIDREDRIAEIRLDLAEIDSAICALKARKKALLNEARETMRRLTAAMTAR